MFPPCNCSTSQFKDDYHGHVITGNLDIVQNSRLKNLLKKGIAYRENVPINWKETYKQIIIAVDKFIDSLCNKKGLSNVMFYHFKQVFLSKVKTQIELCKQRYNHNNNFIPVLKDENVIKELKSLQNNYVLTTVDKASKNIAITCKRFYLQTIYKEIYNDDQINHVYREEQLSAPEAVHIHHSFISSICMNIDKEKYSNLPYIYMVPKFHKIPTKFRFIVASSNCSTKPLSNAISKALQKVRTERKYYCNKLETYDGINRYWIIDNSTPILDCVNRLNDTQTAKSISTYDFSNLYTSLPHSEILNSLSCIVTEVFDYRVKKNKASNLAIYKSKKENELWCIGNWVKKPRSDTFFFTKDSLIKSIKFQLENTFFNFGGKVFSQNIGIPMGTDDGPEIANLHLHQQEYTYLNKLKKTNIYSARKLKYSFRYIDDISSFNADDKILDVATEMYGNNVLLNKENEGTTYANVLDLTINLNPSLKTATTTLFDKRRSFKFDIVNFPDLSGCISSSMAYGVIPSQLLRYYKSCSIRKDLIFNCSILFTKLLQQSYTLKNMETKVKDFIFKHVPVVTKYQCNNKQLFTVMMSAVPRNYKVSGRP